MSTLLRSGAVFAVAAMSLVIAGATTTSTPATADDTMKCFGLNACTENGVFKPLTNACKGKNACKGQGIATLGKTQCLAEGGKTHRS